ncbi:hypothetical protein FQV37_2663 [Psychrobacter nivimaris]|uniref:Uncharacterized protein n=1 Tax=Psychrobacter nivimaris TaxID=281738 RepID=A0A6N7C2R1_9GAMM|nr:hypothetical protein FQV37_2663 [Psychrobacter nivimaris]
MQNQDYLDILLKNKSKKPHENKFHAALESNAVLNNYFLI